MNLDSNLKISVIGVGIMGETILKCLLDSGVSKSQLSFYEKNSERAATIKSTYAIEEKKLSIIGSESAVIFIAVKPQDRKSTRLNSSHSSVSRMPSSA